MDSHLARNSRFSHIYKEDHPWLERRLRDGLRNREDAQDVASEAFTQLLQAPVLHQLSEPRAMLITIARRVTWRLWRRRELERAWLEMMCHQPEVVAPSAESRFQMMQTLCHDAVQSGRSADVNAGYKVTNEITPYAGLIYDLDQRHSIYASWTSVFQPQNYQTPSGAPIAQAQSFCRNPLLPCYSQAGVVRSRGVEFEVAGALTPSWQIMAGYTFNAATYRTDSDGGPAGTRYDTQTPRHLLKASTIYTLPGAFSQWRIGGSVRMQSAISTTWAVRQKAYSVVDGVISYQANRNLDLRLNIYNIFDKYYYQTVGSTQDNNHFGTPRSVLLTAKYTF